MFKNSFYCLAYQLRYLIRQFVASLCHLVMLCLFFCRRVIRSDCALYGFPEIPLKKILNNLENFSVPIELYKNHALLVTFFLIRLTLEFCMEASETSVYAFTAAVFFFFFLTVTFYSAKSYIYRKPYVLYYNNVTSQANSYFFSKR